jgi:hypothetical protein
MTHLKESPLPGRKSGGIKQKRIARRLADPAAKHNLRPVFTVYLRRYCRFTTAELERQVQILHDRIFKTVACRAAALTELDRRKGDKTS